MRRVAGVIGVGLAMGLLLGAPASPATTDRSTDSTGYVPVAPASALHTALESNLKQVRSWLDDGDFASAEQAVRGLAALAWVHGFQGSDAAWRQKTAALREACDALSAAVRRKDAAECDRAMRSCSGFLAELAKLRPAVPKDAIKDFRPPAATKTWMLLMEGTYVDGKTATNAEELQHRALGIAEVANVISYLRTAPSWRKMAGDVRAAALLAAETAGKKDMDTARKAFKGVYRRCEACHQENKP